MVRFQYAAVVLAVSAMFTSAGISQASEICPPLERNWAGQWTSDLDGFEGDAQAKLECSSDGQLQGILPFIEQDNLYKFRVASGDVNNDGTFDIVAVSESQDGATLLLTIKAVYIPSAKTGEPAMIAGEYEIFRVDMKGNFQRVDVGTLGIIAILIG